MPADTYAPTKYPARLRVLVQFGAHIAYFDSVDAGRKVLDDLSAQLAKIREFSNGGEDPIFQFSGVGAFYAIDLRKVTGSSLELVDEWGAIQREQDLLHLARCKAVRIAADEYGLTDELQRLEQRKAALSDANQDV